MDMKKDITVRVIRSVLLGKINNDSAFVIVNVHCMPVSKCMIFTSRRRAR